MNWEDLLKVQVATGRQKLRTSKRPLPEDDDNCREQVREIVEKFKKLSEDFEKLNGNMYHQSKVQPLNLPYDITERRLFFLNDMDFAHPNNPMKITIKTKLENREISLDEIPDEIFCWFLQVFNSHKGEPTGDDKTLWLPHIPDYNIKIKSTETPISGGVQRFRKRYKRIALEYKGNSNPDNPIVYISYQYIPREQWRGLNLGEFFKPQGWEMIKDITGRLEGLW